MSSSSPSSSPSSIIKYVPFQSKSDPSFWMKLGEHKLNTLKLTQDPIDIQGTFTLHSTIIRRDVSNKSKSSTSTSTLTSMTSKSASAASTSNICIPGRMRFDQDSINVNIAPDAGVGADTKIDASKSTTSMNTGNENVITHGKIQILNTLESFKSTDKNELLNKFCLGNLLKACGVDLLSSESEDNDDNDVNAGREEVLDQYGVNTSIQALTSFYCLCHLDLKAHKVLYWFAFPVLTPAPGNSIRYAPYSPSTSDSDAVSESLPAQCTLRRGWGQEKVEQLQKGVHELRLTNVNDCFPSYFIVVPNQEGGSSNSLKCLHLSFQNYDNLTEQEKKECSFAFLDVTSNTSTNNGNDAHTHAHDNSEPVPVGWTLRNLIAYITLKLSIKGVISIISYRPSVIRRIDFNAQKKDTKTEDSDDNIDYAFDSKNDSSLLLQVQLPSKDDYRWPNKKASKTTTPYTCIGWELNARSKPGPRSVNLAPLLSPSHLAQQATDLNLKLMKWRMIPNLDLDSLSNLRVLLLGAGTLGCSVSRTLLGWGVRNFAFVDNGKVSYSNPVRQNLFDLVDCEGGGKEKAIAAADALKRIAGPSINSEGHVLTIPMPGHAFGDKEVESVKKDVNMMQELIDGADVVFLLTDTRESRWLPTVMARASNKMMINAALGLDSWLVMRHGGNEEDGRLGCYFCNDVVAPENSTKNRTLDQQCTVTRPGLAPIASSMAVELMVSLLHHEAKQNAPAPPAAAGAASYSPTVTFDGKAVSPLGVMPHQIRGSIVSYTMMTPTVPAFGCCTGCSDPIISAYNDYGFDFVQEACCSPDASYLEDIAGLTEFRAKAATMMEDCLDWDDANSDDEFE
jgi:ubiquitin-like modifier-activating enzyme ATG7